MFDGIKNVFRGAATKMANILLQDSRVAAASTATDMMSLAQQEWLSMYIQSAADPLTMGLPAAVSSEIARLVTLELVYTVVEPGETESDIQVETRAKYLNSQIQPFIEQIRKYSEYGCAGGGIVFKPYVDANNALAIDTPIANDFTPLNFDSRGNITSCAFAEHKRVGSKYYHKIETHTLDGGLYTVTNRAFFSTSPNAKGRPCKLSEVPEWERLSDEETIGNVNIPLYSYFMIPSGNSVDMASPLGVSVFYKAIPQIKEADKQWERYLWEFEAGAMMMEASKDAFKIGTDGNPIIPEGKERLFWATEFDSSDSDSRSLTKFHSPEFREIALKAGLNTILQRIEFNCGLAYGTLSDPQVVDKTAEEIKTSKQRSYTTVNEVQKSLKNALDGLVAAMDVYATLYSLAPEGQYEIKDIWDDSIIIDAKSEQAFDLQEVKAGLMLDWEYRVKWKGEDEETAKAKLAGKAKADPFSLQ